MGKLSKRHFWVWFKNHHQEFLSLNNKSKKEAKYWLTELNAHLRAYYKFFGFTIDLKSDQPGATLTITVYGKSMHFKKVDDLVAMAPQIPGWNFVALQQPRPVDFLLNEQIEDNLIDPRELRFSFGNDDPDNLILIVYHPLCTDENQHLIYKLAQSAVYNLLGERSYGNDIHWLHVTNLSAAGTADVEELEALPASIGLRKSSIMIDSKGNLVSVN
jgi:hypothetical protein